MADRFSGCALLFVERVEPLFGAEAVVRFAFFNEFDGIVFKKPHAFALHIRSVVASDVRTFVPRHAVFFERVVDNVDGAFDKSRLIGVFDTQNENAVFMTRGQVRVKGGAQVADVHVSGRTGRKTSANFAHLLLQI